MKGHVTYAGRRSLERGCEVTFQTAGMASTRYLPARTDLARHSRTGFDWGYGGSGPAQLALALLAHRLGDRDRALALHQRFKAEVVASWITHNWRLTGAEIDAWVERAETPARPFLGETVS